MIISHKKDIQLVFHYLVVLNVTNISEYYHFLSGWKRDTPAVGLF